MMTKESSLDNRNASFFNAFFFFLQLYTYKNQMVLWGTTKKKKIIADIFMNKSQTEFKYNPGKKNYFAQYFSFLFYNFLFTEWHYH